jgi:hypothetical protein
MIEPERATGRVAWRGQQHSTDAWWIVDGVGMRHDHRRTEPTVSEQIDPARKLIQHLQRPEDRWGIRSYEVFTSCAGHLGFAPQDRRQPRAASFM